MTNHYHLINFKEVGQTPNYNVLTERPNVALPINQCPVEI